MSFRQFRPLEKNEFIVVGCDTSAGGNDYSVAQFVSKTHLDVPLVFHANISATYMTDRLMPVLERIYDVTGIKPVVAYERQNGGVFEIERLSNLNRQDKYRIYLSKNVGNIDNPSEKKLGWDTTSASRPKMLSDLKDAVDGQLMRIYDKMTVTEMYSFIINKQGKPEAEVNAHDDLIMALAIAWQLYQTENQQTTQIPNVVTQNIVNRKRWQLS
jgi:hypothetical protein